MTVTNPASTPELASDCAIFPALPPTLSVDFVGAVNFPDSDRISEIENKLLYQTPIKGLTGSNKSKGKWATQFRMPGFPYALITTDIFREGEDLHTYCDNIYHVLLFTEIEYY